MAPAAKKAKTEQPSVLEQLKTMTTVVCDTGEFEAIKKFEPTDATTNPSLIYKAAQMKEYSHLVDNAIEFAKETYEVDDPECVSCVIDKLSVNFGAEITKIVPGYVSTEVDARLSFDKELTLKKARHLIDLYKAVGIDKSRILIKIASTWEGIQAARELEKEGITVNLTLLFSMAQAVAAAEADATLISPFVGRILDWHKKASGKESYPPKEDPGVVSVTKIYSYYKKFGYKTIVMGASFRNVDEITQLAGCDRLTIAPALLEKLGESNAALPRMLTPDSPAYDGEKIELTEPKFRYMMCQDPMATDKLAEGIRGFSKDIESLEAIVREKLNASK